MATGGSRTKRTNPGRSWGFWTLGKLDLLRDYLHGFTTASHKKSREIVYLDLFAGVDQNYDRLTDKPIDGSARIALSTTPPFTRVRLFELAERAGGLKHRLSQDFPDRSLEVYPGDCNKTIPQALADLQDVVWAPTFAFIDPEAPNFHWLTLKALADHKRAQKFKVELWLLFPDGLFLRNLPVDQPVQPEIEAELTEMFGTDEWRLIYEARREGQLQGSEAREEYVNLMRWRLQEDLGYQWTHPLEIVNMQHVPIYHMIFATDNRKGDKIMRHLYDRAAREFPAMRRQALEHRRLAKEEASGVLNLFQSTDLIKLAKPIAGLLPLYQYEAPVLPYGRRSPE